MNILENQEDAQMEMEDLKQKIDFPNKIFQKNQFQPELFQSKNEKMGNNSIQGSENQIMGILNSEYYLIKKIGSGSSGLVYLSYSIYDKNLPKTLYATKIMDKPEPNYKILENSRINYTEKMNHKNIIKVYGLGSGLLQTSPGITQKVYYIIMEYLDQGSLLSQIIDNMGFGEDFGRLIFAQLLDGLEVIHNSNVVHRDIKLENIMLGNDYTLKYVDFGFATEKSNGYLTTYLGTPSYAAPELHMKRPYLGVYEDIFSLGVTLFITVTGYMPFILPMPNDPLYHYISIGDYITYWRKRNIKVSPSFMELFNNLIAFDPSQRPSISEIKNSKWMKEINWELLPALRQEFMKREEIFNTRKQNAKNIMKELINKNLNKNNNNNNTKNVDEILLEKKIEFANDMRKKLFNMNNIVEQNSPNNIKRNEDNDNDNKSHKIEQKGGFILIKNNFNSMKALMILLKNFFKKEGYNETKKDLDNLQMEISNGEIDILLIFERMNKEIKISYYLKNGIKKDLIDFKKVMKKIHLK